MMLSASLLVILIAIGAVGLFVLGLSLTIIIKGRYIDSEIGDNRHMQQRGIECTARQIRTEEAAYYGRTLTDEECREYGCTSCSVGNCVNNPG